MLALVSSRKTSFAAGTPAIVAHHAARLTGSCSVA
jgi:hypothetical protein